MWYQAFESMCQLHEHVYEQTYSKTDIPLVYEFFKEYFTNVLFRDENA